MSFATRREAIEDRLTQRDASHTVSLARQRLRSHIATAIARFVRGPTMDCGAGRSPYTDLLTEQASHVTVVDIEDRSGRVDVIADIQDMPQLSDAAFSSVLCTQVLEHVPSPRRAISEMSRVLAPGGHLILSVPHLSAIHEAPHDYYRYTCFALTWLCEEAGLEVVQIEATGGLISFIAHGASVALMTTVGGVQGLFWPAWLLNSVLFVSVAGLLDRLVGFPGRYPCDYVVVARKEG